MGKYQLTGDAGTVEVIAGEYNGVKGPATTFTPIQMYNVRLKKGGNVTLNLPENFNTGILVVEGSVKVNESETAPQDHFILFKNDGETISLHSEEDAVLLVLSGEPIDEPIVAYGPFVMNTHDEIQEAMDDFRMGKYGVLED
jgi:redox-sensitive bicupin YhaK (pirin superfamily)